MSKKTENTIVEEEVETQENDTEEARSAFEFDPELWMDGMYKDNAKSEQSEEEEEEPVAETEEVTSEEVKEEVEEKEEVDETQEVLAEAEEEKTDDSWKSLAEDLNIEAESYQDLLGKINTMKAPAYIDENETISGINQVLSLKDDDLLKAYKTYVEGYDQDEAEEILETLNKNGMLKFEIKKARKFFQNQKQTHIEEIKKNKEDNNAKRVQAHDHFTNQIKDIVSKTEKIFDIVLFKDDQKKQIQDYILTGKFQKEVLADPKSLVDFAYFNKFRDMVTKVLTQQGESKGIKSMIENQKPLKSKTSYTVSDKQKGIFDPDKFLSGLYK